MKPVILVVLDGYGIAPPGPGNAIELAHPRFINSLLDTYPHTKLGASGEAVGLPAGEPGNTEVGHINLGAGTIVFQDLPRINMSIADGSFYKNPAFIGAIKHVKKTGGGLHLIGLIGQGTVHSCLDHLYALLYFAKEHSVKNVFIHVITDGRDSPPKSALVAVRRLEEKLKDLQIGTIASISGRYYAMDRDRRWERTEKEYVCIIEGIGKTALSAQEAIANSYNLGITDEFIEPTNIIKENSSITLISDNDAVIFFNFRIDRPRQLTKALVLLENTPFVRKKKIKNLYFVTMTEYEPNLPVHAAFLPKQVKNPLDKVLSDNNIKHLLMSESEKERFVTYYFNGLHEQPYPHEEKIIISSPKVPTYDLKPEMSAYELTETLIEKIKTRMFSFILINFANADMVGHTGSIEATIKAIQAVNICTEKLVDEALINNYSLIITADHGNAEQKLNPETGEMSTEHTSSPVPCIIVSKEYQGKPISIAPGILADIAPTILGLLNIPKPEEMTGRNFIDEIK